MRIIGWSVDRRVRRDVWILWVAWLMATEALAVNASPDPVDLVQPDGTPLKLYIRGDEYSHWFEDQNGYSVARSGKAYYYAERDGAGNLVAGRLPVGRLDPAVYGVPKGLVPSPEARRRRRIEAMPPEQRDSAMKALPVARSLPSALPSAVPSAVPRVLKNLVILCRFSDHRQGQHTRLRSDYGKLFNGQGGDPEVAPTGSVRDYYREVSYGKLDLRSVVTVWVTLPHAEAYYANGTNGLGGTYPANSQGMVEDALNLVDEFVDFAEFDQDNDGFIDAIDIVHSGYGAETGGGGGNWIWSHQWSLYALPGGAWNSQDVNASGYRVKVYGYHTEPALWGTSGREILRIGVICHETGHFLGLPDLYDIDGSSSGAGSYCLMANSWGFDGSQLHPPHLSAWCKIQLGWITPVVINSGAFTLSQVETAPTVYRVDQGFGSGEYLLIENRQPVGFESAMPQGGLAIWHVDERVQDNTREGFPGQVNWPWSGTHYKVALLQADGRYDLERGQNRGDATDVYHQGGKSKLTPFTLPNTHRYQFGFSAPTNNTFLRIGLAGPTMRFLLNKEPAMVTDP